MHSALKDPVSSAAVPFVPQSRRNPALDILNVNLLRPLMRILNAWFQLPRPSRWLLRTIWLGYAIQFTRRLPKFSGKNL